MKVFIEWEHGDADFRITESYDVKDISRFLDFIFELKGWIPNQGYEKLGYFQDGSNEREWDFVEKMIEKHGEEFYNYVPMDKRFGHCRPAINAIWLKDGKEKYIVWKKCLEGNRITLPKIGDTIKMSSGHVCGHATSAYGLTYKQILMYEQLEKIGYGMKPGGKEYMEFDVIVKDVKLHIDEKHQKEYHSDFISFHYVLLCEFQGKLLSYSMYGWDESLNIDHPRLYIH